MLLYCSGTYQVIKPQLLVSLAYLQITPSGDQFLALLYHIITCWLHISIILGTKHQKIDLFNYIIKGIFNLPEYKKVAMVTS